MNGVRVVKVGGSLFNVPTLGETLQAWLAAQPLAANVLIAGGGALANGLRGFSTLHPQPCELWHRLCLQAMSITSRMLHALLPQSVHCTQWRQVATALALPQPPCVVLDTVDFLATVDAARPDPLPASWNVTSDAIAARVAECLAASELVLLKSTLPANEAAHLSAWSAAQLVDDYFPTAAASLPRIRFVNLRHADWQEVIAKTEH